VSVYTTFDMIADCRTGKPAGWIHFVTHFLPPCRRLLTHYGGDEARLRDFLTRCKQALPALEPAAERLLLTRLRPLILESAGYPQRPVAAPPDLEVFTTALADLSILERQMVWTDTMDYEAAAAAAMLRASEETVTKTRDKAAELLRSQLDSWTRTILRDCGPALGDAVRAVPPEEPVAFRDYIEIIDGRLTWLNRVPVERSLAASWFEIDHLCRVREADEAIHSCKPLVSAEAEPYLAIFGIQPEKPSLWKRLLASR